MSNNVLEAQQSTMAKEEIRGEAAESVKNQVPSRRSCLTKNPSIPFGERPRDPLYSCTEEQFGKEREAKITERDKSYIPFIEPIELRNHRRLAVFNPHFWRIPRSKHMTKRTLFVRLGVIDLTLQNGLGSRYRLVPPPTKSFDFPMKCVAKALLGSKCFAGRLREEACLEVVRQWEKYKWEVKFSYSIHMEFFRQYNPDGTDEGIHKRGMYLYKVAVFERMYECKRVELAAACNLYGTNFYCIECFPEENDRFLVIPTETNFGKSLYFFAKEVAYVRKTIDRKNDLYENLFFIWLNPIIKAGHNLTINQCIMKITYSNSDIGYFHLFEEDPEDPIDLFNETNHYKRVRNHYVQYCPTVYSLHYYQPPRCRPCQSLKEGLGIYYESEVDERILTYNKLLIDRFHYLEIEFYRITELSYPGFPIGNKQYKRHTKQLEEFLSHLKSRTEKDYKRPTYRAEQMKKMYIEKRKKRRMRKLAIGKKARMDNPHKVNETPLEAPRPKPPRKEKDPLHPRRHKSRAR